MYICPSEDFSATQCKPGAQHQFGARLKPLILPCLSPNLMTIVMKTAENPMHNKSARPQIKLQQL